MCAGFSAFACILDKFTQIEKVSPANNTVMFPVPGTAWMRSLKPRLLGQEATAIRN